VSFETFEHIFNLDVFQVLIVFPSTTLAYLLNSILPKVTPLSCFSFAIHTIAWCCAPESMYEMPMVDTAGRRR
jgi:hypothetical protein